MLTARTSAVLPSAHRYQALRGVDVDLSDLVEPDEPVREPSSIRPNAAEIWAASLPDPRIWERRRELERRELSERKSVTPVLPADDTPEPDPEPADRSWLATVLLLLALVACCWHFTGI